ncbi:MAG: DNA polymerase III subunit alpha [Phycisphaerae bacterium]|nr:DNA polymerase III subunit alpha [Phycisphaerae bacterium]
MTQFAPPFVHLHVHTHYSLLDGATRIPDLVNACKNLNMPAVAITDHGNMFGSIEFYKAATAAGIRPIIGCETYLAPADRRDKRDPGGNRETAYHQLLLAANLTGYRNLLKLCSIGYLEGFYYKPRIDKDVLRQFSAGLICTSTCLGGEVPQAFLKQDAAAARRVAEEFLDIFGPERFFIELQNHGLPEQKTLNPELAALAKRLGVATIATNDVHYLSHDDVEAHDVLCCISTRARVADENRFKFESDQFYLKSPQEMLAALPDYPEALANTMRVVEMCNLELDFSKRYAPVYRAPDEKSADDYLRELVYAGAASRYGANRDEAAPSTSSPPSSLRRSVAPSLASCLSDELRERIDYELSVIRDKGFSGYFLIVWDFVRYCREHDIPCGARGSGCSTVVGYCLRVSDVDPLKYGLYFERFMDPERDEMPDIDVDMCQDRRQEVIDYVRQKYGHVAQIITFGTLKARAAIRDVCRTLDVPLSEADRIAKLVPEELKMTIEKALEREPALRQLYDGDPKIRRVLDISKRLEGLARHASVHAAGVVIADQPLDTLVPLYKPADSDDVITQYEGATVEKVGLLKMDFLGLRTLSQIHRTCQLVRAHHGRTIDLESLDLEDPRVYELLSRGDTRGVFQFESGGMRDVLMKMKPNRIFDLIAANALYRPGPMQYIDEYIARKHGKSWTTPHANMTEVLSETYGIMVYQEQVSRLVNRLGDVPLRRAFRLAKAISKKNTKMIDAEREPFLAGAEKNGVPRKVGEQIFADILQFGGYAFNKAHSSGYALLAFQTAWLKTYHPVEFMASLLTYESGDRDKVADYIQECRHMRQPDGSVGIPVEPPDVNRSELAFTVVYDEGTEPRSHGATKPRRDGGVGRGRVLFGLAAINGLGEKAINAIIEARRQGGPFRDIYDFCERVDLAAVNKAALESLVKAGAFDRTGAMRGALWRILGGAMEHGQAMQRDRRSGQMSMFGELDVGAAATAGGAARVIPADEWSESEMLAHEKETLGFYVTKHPLTQHLETIERFRTTTIAAAKGMSEGARVVLGGLISKVREVPIKNGRSAGKRMAVIQLEDLSGGIEAVVFPDQLDALRPRLRPDSVVFLSGEVDKRREDACIRTGSITPVEDAARELARGVVVRLRSLGGPAESVPRIRELVRAHRGRCPLFLEVSSADGWRTVIEADGGAAVSPSGELLRGLAAVVGEGNVSCVGGRWN